MLETLKKLNFLITKRQGKGLVIITLLLFVGMILEVFGLGILIPALSILLDPEVIESTPLLAELRSLFASMSYQNFLIFFLLAIVLLYTVKTLFLILLNHKQNRFLSNVTASVSNKLFESYMGQAYTFHLQRNAAELIKNIQVEINYFGAFLIALITIAIEGGIVVSVLSFLIYMEPLGAISIGLFFGLLSMLFLQFTKRKLKIWGAIRQDLDTEVSKTALEGLGGIKDIIILGKSKYFSSLFSEKNFFKARINANQGTIAQIPRFFLELISITGLVSFIILMVVQGKEAASLVTVLGVFVAATFRMIPSLNRIIAAIQNIKYYETSVNVVYSEIKSYSETHTHEPIEKEVLFTQSIALENLTFSFKEGKDLLKDAYLHINKGQTVGIIGASGAGKSTLVDLIIGLQAPNSGTIKIDGLPGLQMSNAWRKQIGYVSQTIYLTDNSIQNNIAFGVPETAIDQQKIATLLEQVQLTSFVNALTEGIHTKVGERGVQLSGGQRQRIGIARALYNNPSVLVLDEATSALDLETEKEVMKAINALKGQKTIIMIAHRMATLASADVVYEVNNGKMLKV